MKRHEFTRQPDRSAIGAELDALVFGDPAQLTEGDVVRLVLQQQAIARARADYWQVEAERLLNLAASLVSLR